MTQGLQKLFYSLLVILRLDFQNKILMFNLTILYISKETILC